MNERNRRLELLALKAKKQLPGTEGRTEIFNQVMKEIEHSGQPPRPPRQELPAQIHEEFIQEAKQELRIFIWKNIDKYQPEKGEVTAWLNTYFYWRFRDLVTAWKKNYYVDINPDNIMSPQNKPSLTEMLLDVIETDSNGIFRAKHIAKRPDVNFQALALRWLKGKTWEDIATEFNVNAATIRGFYRRCLIEFRNILRNSVQE